MGAVPLRKLPVPAAQVPKCVSKKGHPSVIKKEKRKPIRQEINVTCYILIKVHKIKSLKNT